MHKIKTLLLSLLIAGAAMAQYPVLPIDSVQFINAQKLGDVKFNVSGQDGTLPDWINPTFKDQRYRDTVTVEGYITFDPRTYGLSTTLSRAAAFIQQDSFGRPWNGVELMWDSAVSPASQAVTQFFQNLRKGRKIRASGVIRDFQGQTQLTLINVPTEVLEIDPVTIVPRVITVKDLNMLVNNQVTPQFTTGEQWEGVYVEIRNVTVRQDPNNIADGNRFFWDILDDSGNVVPIRDVSGYFRNDNFDRDPNTPRNPRFNPPPTGTKIPYIRGVVVEASTGAFKRYNLAPLNPDDVSTASVQPPSVSNITRTPRIAGSTNPVKITARIVDSDGTLATTRLYYTVGYNNPTFTALNMTSAGNDIYEATIPAQAEGSIVRFYVEAIDDANEKTIFPAENGRNSAYKVVGKVTSIRQIQETPFDNGASMFTNDTFTNAEITATVLSTVNNYDLGAVLIQDAPGEWSSIFVRPSSGDNVAAWERGDRVRITGFVVTERTATATTIAGALTVAGTTFIENIGSNVTIIDRCASVPTGIQVPFDSIVSPTFNKEPYEAVLLEFRNMFVSDTNPDFPSNFGEWAVAPAFPATLGLRLDDHSNDIYSRYNRDTLSNGLPLSIVRGPLVFNFGNWKLIPRNRTDIGRMPDMVPPKLFLIGADTIRHPRGTTYTDPGATACDDTDGNINSRINRDESNLNINVAGTYQVRFSVTDNAGNAAPQRTRIVIVEQGQSVNNLPQGLQISLAPNPSAGNTSVIISGAEIGNGQITVRDLQGRVVFESAVNNGAMLPSSSWAPGMYLVNVSGDNWNWTQKLSILR